jgi:stearoyl-CoA desaturase (Delta-9 desaturase)
MLLRGMRIVPLVNHGCANHHGCRPDGISDLLRWFTELSPVVGSAAAMVVACLYGRPTHVIVTTPVLAILTGLGISLGYHRLFAHRSFATYHSVERLLMILGCMASIAPFYWISVHRAHHRHCDQDGDPHSPHIGDGRRLGLWQGLWHAYFDWIHVHGYSYRISTVAHLIRRPDFVWIDRYWYQWYLLGLAIPTLIGFAIGGTAYDALIGFLWGGRSPVQYALILGRARARWWKLLTSTSAAARA